MPTEADCASSAHGVLVRTARLFFINLEFHERKKRGPLREKLRKVCHRGQTKRLGKRNSVVFMSEN